MLGGSDPDDEAFLCAVGGTGAAQDRFVGEPVGPRSTDVEDLGAGSVGRFGRQPARENGGNLVGVTLADVGHGAALYRRLGPSVRVRQRHRCGSEGTVGRRRVASHGVLIVLDVSGATASLRQPDEFTRFSVALEGHGDLARAVRQSGLGRLHADGAHVVVDPAALRALAGPAANEAWDEGFAGMCAYAAGKGWVEADGGVLAHIDTGPEPG